MLEGLALEVEPIQSPSGRSDPEVPPRFPRIGEYRPDRVVTQTGGPSGIGSIAPDRAILGIEPNQPLIRPHPEKPLLILDQRREGPLAIGESLLIWIRLKAAGGRVDQPGEIVLGRYPESAFAIAKHIVGVGLRQATGVVLVVPILAIMP